MTLIEITEMMGNVGEFLASIVVLITLIYIAIQARYARELLDQNHKIALSNIHSVRTQMLQTIDQQVVESESLAAIQAKIRDATSAIEAEEVIDELSPVDRRRLQAWNQQSAWRVENLLYQQELGLLDERVSEDFLARIPTYMPAWKKLDVTVLPRIQEFLESQNPT
jgi:hypothetical protein